MTDIEQVIASRKPRTVSRPLVMDGELLGEIDQVRAMRDQARLAERAQPQGLGSPAEKLGAQLNELVERAANEAVTFVAKTVDADWLDELKRNHPPSSAQMERYKERAAAAPMFARPPVINPDTAGPELLAQAMVDPAMNVDQAARLWVTSRGQRNELWSLVWDIQEEGSELPFSSAGTGMTGGGAGESNTPATRESPSPSSKGG